MVGGWYICTCGSLPVIAEYCELQNNPTPSLAIGNYQVIL